MNPEDDLNGLPSSVDPEQAEAPAPTANEHATAQVAAPVVATPEATGPAVPPQRWKVSRSKIIMAVCAIVAVVLAGAAAWAFMTFTRVPDLVGAEQPSLETLEDGSVSVGIGTDGCANAGIDQSFCMVESQEPEAGAFVKKGSTVTVTTSPIEVGIPDVKGKSFDTATKELADAGLKVSLGNDTSSEDMDLLLAAFKHEAPTWSVASLDPAGGTQAKAGTNVKLVVDFPQVTVPDVKGKSVADAKTAMTTAGVMAAAFPEEAGAAVASQQPEAGSSVKFGSSLKLTWDVAVPEFKATDGPKDVRAALAAAGLTMSVSPKEATDEWSTDWRVAGTEPAAGKRLAIGSTVTVNLKEPQIVYSVEGDGTDLQINWTSPNGGSSSSANDAESPWSKSFPLSDATKQKYGYYLSVFASGGMDGTFVTCKITVDDKVVAEERGTGEFSHVSCNYDSY